MVTTGHRVKELRTHPPVRYLKTPGGIPVGTRSIFVYQYTGVEWALCYEDKVLPYAGTKTFTVNDGETLHISTAMP